MKSTVTVINDTGLDAKASAKLTKLAGSFACDVWLTKAGRQVNAKSIMGVMMLAAGSGSGLELETQGADEAMAHAQITNLFATGLQD